MSRAALNPTHGVGTAIVPAVIPICSPAVSIWIRFAAPLAEAVMRPKSWFPSVSLTSA